MGAHMVVASAYLFIKISSDIFVTINRSIFTYKSKTVVFIIAPRYLKAPCLAQFISRLILINLSFLFLIFENARKQVDNTLAIIPIAITENSRLKSNPVNKVLAIKIDINTFKDWRRYNFLFTLSIDKRVPTRPRKNACTIERK